VFTARYALSPYIKQTRFVFKGLNIPCGDMKQDTKFPSSFYAYAFPLTGHSVICTSYLSTAGEGKRRDYGGA
jgi:hypothetical protein